MYLHIGRDEMVPLNDIILIINLENHLEQATREFLELARLDKKNKGVELKKAKTCIITKTFNYFSTISAQTLWRRGISKLGSENS